MRLGPLPDWLQQLAIRLFEDGIFQQVPDQVIVNEYLPGQGIAAHVDCEPCFGPVIASLSLGAPVPMVFGNRRTREVVEVDLPPRSLLVLSGEGRYEWTHSILARKTDVIDGRTRDRVRRVSLTFRTVIFNQPTD
jgi:alkylated DNA repair dioxygenase AlkB